MVKSAYARPDAKPRNLTPIPPSRQQVSGADDGVGCLRPSNARVQASSVTSLSFRIRRDTIGGGVPMYIDPNTGGMLFQLLAVLFTTVSGILLFFSGRIRTFFARLRRRLREGQGLGKEKPERPKGIPGV